ncbi:MAG TPA: hypothetical protein VEJ87_01485, partial [Acidimicrobiales bacterium]|nr:hypothetical protein [Acidimicrobiales bacterium]
MRSSRRLRIGWLVAVIVLSVGGIAGATNWVVQVTAGAHPAQSQATTVNPPSSAAASSPTSSSLVLSWSAGAGAPPTGYTVTR